MSGLDNWTRNPAALTAIGAAVVAVGSLVAWRLLHKPVSEEELERRRRELVNTKGRTIEGEVTDADGVNLHYVYSVRGVEYEATQDITTITEVLPKELERIIGVVSVKYLLDNPANSIVVCEQWSGIDSKPPHTPKKR